MWFYGLHANNCGTYVKKPMTQCSGEEIMQDFLYYCGLENKIDEIMPSITAIRTSRSSASSWSWRVMWCSPWKPLSARR